MTGPFEFEGSAFLPLREVVYESIRKAILTEKLHPGERLMENMIATKLGVSRTPVREAIRMLSDEGLVLIIPRRGAQVASISRKELDDVLEIRESLEALAIGRACERITDAMLDELSEAQEYFRSMTADGELTELARADEDFHAVIYRAAGNRRLDSIISNLREQMYRFRLEYLKKPGICEELVAEHDAIIEAVRQRNKKLAERLITVHVDKQREAIACSLPEE